MKDKRFQPYEPDQSLLLPPNMNDWLPEWHPAFFIREVVGRLDLSAIYNAYADGAKGGKPPCDPRMMTGLLLYAYCVGVRSSRKIEKATYEVVPFRVLSADQHPDHPKAGRYAAIPYVLSAKGTSPRSLISSSRYSAFAARRGWRNSATSRSTGRRCSRTHRSTRR
jgi:transposase